MRNNEVMRIFKLFTITQFDKEQEYLREMNKKGYKLARYSGLGMYYFERCEKEDVVYQLDFYDGKIEDKECYLQIFRDAGWEYMFDAWGWSYFRKSAADGNPDLSIFSDIQSHISLLTRIIKWKLVPLLVVFFSIIIPQIVVNYFTWQDDGARAIYSKIMLAIFVVFFFTYLFLFSYIGLGLHRLKQKYINGEK